MSLRSFAHALDLLNLASSTGVLSQSATDFLTARLSQLKAPQDPFPRSSGSKTKIQSGTAMDGTAVSTEEQARILDIAGRFELDEIESMIAWRRIKNDGTKRKDKLLEEDWDLLTAEIFEERMAVISIVGTLLRCCKCSFL
jgi:nuclear pore complex protein Nup188